MLNVKKFINFFIYLSLLFCSPLHASWTPFVTVSTPGDFASQPDVATDLDSSGQAMAVWAEQSPAHQIFASLFNAGVWGTPVPVSAAGGTPAVPKVGMDATGKAIAVWQRSNGSNVIIQSSTFDGSTWSSPVNLSLIGQNASAPQISVNASTKAVAVWQRSNGTNIIIQAAFYNGTTWGAPVNLSVTGRNASSPQVSINASGHAVAVWHRSNGTNTIVQASFFNGTTWSSAVNLSTAGFNSTDAHVSINSSDNAMATWTINNASTDLNIQSAKFNGTTWAAPVTITSAPFQSTDSRVQLLPSGTAVAVWSHFDGLNTPVEGSFYNGTSWGPIATISSATISSLNIRLGINSSGLGFALWRKFNNAASAFNVQAAPFNGISWGSPVDITLPTDDDVQPALSVNSMNNAVAVWAQQTPSVEVQASVNFSEDTSSTVVANPTSVFANGIDSSLITVTLLDGSGNPIVGSTVSLSQGGGSSVISAPSGPSDASGVVTFTVTDTTIETVTYTATDVTHGVVITQKAQVSFTSAESAFSTVSASPASVPNDGLTTSTITVTLLNGVGSPIVGNTVSLSQGAGSSTISAPSGPSDASGVVTFTVTDTTVETVTYTATDVTTGTVITQTAQVSFFANERTESTVIANPTMQAADGVSSSTVTVTLLDGSGNPLPGRTVSLSQGGGSSTISPPSGISDAFGVVVFTVTDSTVEIVTYTATDLTSSTVILQTAQIDFQLSESTRSTVVANPTQVLADGTQTSTITVTLLDGSGNPIVGNVVSLSQGSGSSMISAPSGPSNAFGVVTFTVTDMTPETVTFQATDVTNSVVISQTAQVLFISTESTSSTVVANPTTVMADGSSFSIITVTLLNGTTPIVGNTVILAQGSGSSAINPLFANTNASGEAFFTVTNLVQETVTYQATDITTGEIIVQTAQVTFSNNVPPPPPAPPSNFHGKVKKNKFGMQTEYMDVLSWDPSPDPTVTGYRIFQAGHLVASVGANGPFTVTIHNISKKKTYTYVLVAVNAAGVESTPLILTLP